MSNKYTVDLISERSGVEGFIVDGRGRRLGYSEATGTVTEIPDSVWLGKKNGIGFISGLVEGPIQLQLTGTNENYYIKANIETADGVAVVESEGFLAEGKELTLDVPLLPEISITGSVDRDILIGTVEDESIEGLEGNDRLQGGAGNDTINGGAGNDTVVEVADTNFTITDTTLIGNGNDTLTQIESASLRGGDADNALIARDATQINVTLDGGLGDDNLVGGALGDYLVGRNGNDRLAGKKGNDSLDGGLGDDTLFGDGGIDQLFEAADADLILTDTTLTGSGTDSLFGIELARLQGGASDNLIDASAVTQMKVTLDGAIAGGNDTLIGGAKNDFLMGRNGDDRLEGRDGNDSLYGHQGSDSLYGDKGNDFLNGGSGSDTLFGGGGNDTLFGNDGNDVFVLESRAGEDVITDFDRDFDLFGLTISIGFSDLSITDNTDRTATLIKDTTNNNELLAIVNNVSADSITAADFTNI